ncbi:MAG: L,D-transpeptidase family protein [Pseudonocardia sp.]|nr:L,D-transpeptidase family protein [Pseudonocardia sp.]
MTGKQLDGRRLTVVVTSVLCLSGLAGTYFARAAFAESEAADQARQTPLVPGTACTITAKSCVDLESQRAWLFNEGKIIRGPVKISSGGNGKETPIGHSLRVYRKDKNFKSTESRLPNGRPAPMPWSVFFEDGGIAFHSGDPHRSSGGCIHLADSDAQAWFNYLQIGDQVQVVRASQELAARKNVRPAAPDQNASNQHNAENSQPRNNDSPPDNDGSPDSSYGQPDADDEGSHYRSPRYGEDG